MMVAIPVAGSTRLITENKTSSLPILQSCADGFGDACDGWVRVYEGFTGAGRTLLQGAAEKNCVAVGMSDFLAKP